MNLFFVLPSIHDLPTGGNVYNRRMIEALQWGEHVNIECLQFSRDSRGREAIRNLSGFDAVIVDSLILDCVHDIEAIDTPVFLLAHYLRICDPTASEANRRLTERNLLNAYDGYITTSHYTKNCLLKAGALPDQVVVAYPGLDAAFRAFENSTPQSLDACRMLTVASLLPGKGLSDHIHVLAYLDNLPWTWTIVGEGSLNPAYRDQFLTEIAELSVGDRIHWEGAKKEMDMPDLYREFDLLVQPSQFETLGMVIREGMAAGLPVIAYDVGGISESLVGGGGILIHPYHPAQMIDELTRLIGDPDERSKLGNQGLQQSRYFPSWKEAASRFIDGINALTH